MFCVLFCLPAYLFPEIVEQEYVESKLDYLSMTNYTNNTLFVENTTKKFMFLIEESELSKRSNGKLLKSMFYSQAIFGKLLPCVLLVTFSLLQIKWLIIFNRKKKALIIKNLSNLIKDRQFMKHKRMNENLRTTLMLIVVCVLFLISEFPPCVLLLFSLEDTDFYLSVYIPLGDLMDMIALLNNSINFVLYCTMSRAFRETFYSIFNSVCSSKSRHSIKLKMSSPVYV